MTGDVVTEDLGRILAFLTLAIVGTSLSAFQTRTAPVDATGFTVTHISTPVLSRPRYLGRASYHFFGMPVVLIKSHHPVQVP
jgi:hypothetical protein